MTSADPKPDIPRADPSIFKDAVLTSVMVWKYGVSLSFNDEPMAITIEGNAEIRSNGRSENHDAQGGIALGARLLELLDRKVVSVAYDEKAKALVLAFDGSVELTLRPDDTGYESYQINVPGRSPLIA